MDFTAEGKHLLRSGLVGHRYENLNIIYQDPATSGCIYVGDHTAAESEAILKDRGITHIVNCTDDLPLYHEGHFRYLRFHAAGWSSLVDFTHSSVMRFVEPLFGFVDEALATGNSVLVHCLAGAHRAGTTGCLLLMRMHDESPAEATMRAKSHRSVINP